MTGAISHGEVDMLYPFMEWDGFASNWLLFEAERSTVPRPWLSGTLLLTNVRLHFDPEHIMLLAGNPHMEAFEVLSKPVLMMSEVNLKDHVLGSGWAFMDSLSPSLDQLEPEQGSALRRVRFMQYTENNYARTFITYEHTEELVVFSDVREVSGRTNAICHGFINRHSRQCTVLSANVDNRNCLECSQAEKVCTCDNLEVSQYFERQYLKRRSLGEVLENGYGNRYFSSWITGTWTSNIKADVTVKPFRLQVLALLEGKAFQTALTFVIQNEVLAVQPPRASQRFLAMLRGAKDSHEVEDWSSVVESIPVPEDQDQQKQLSVLRQPVSEVSSDLDGSIVCSLGSKRRRSPSLTLVAATGRELIRSDGSENTSAEVSPARKSSTSATSRKLIQDSPAEIEDLSRGSTENLSSSPGQKMHGCEECSMKFRRRYDLTRHVRTVHEKRRDFKCPECDKLFSQRGHVNEHVRLVHKGKKRFECSTCNKLFGAKSKLDRHIRSVHENVRRLPCEMCSKTFKDKVNLENHMATHKSVNC